MARALHRLGLLCARWKWVVLGVWVLGIALLIGLAHGFGSNTSNNLRLPGTDSQAATDLLAARFPPQQNGSNPLVFHTATGKVNDADNKQAIEASYKQLKKLPHVAGVVDPFAQQGSHQISRDKKTAFIPVLLDVGGSELTQEIAESVLRAGDPGLKAGMDVAVGGSVGGELSEPATESSEVIGLVAAMIILAFTFGTLVAMGLPIVSAVLGLAAGLSLITIHRPWRDRSHDRADPRDDDRPWGRHRLRALPGHTPPRQPQAGDGAAGVDRDGGRHSGSAIVFAGTTVVIALLALLVAGIPLVTALGYSAAVAVVTAVLAALTLLPAVLALVGHAHRVGSPPIRHAALAEGCRSRVLGWLGAAAYDTAVVGDPRRVRAMIPLIVPFLSLNLGQEDIGATPKSTTERRPTT